AADTPLVEACLVSTDYFKTMGIPLKSGRFFTEHDNKQHLVGRDLSGYKEVERQMLGLNVIIIDEEFSRKYWPNEDPVGKRIKPGNDAKAPILTVVGVVGRVHMEELKSATGFVQGYFAFNQMPFSGMNLEIKSTLPPDTLISSVRRQVLALDPNQPIYNIRTMDQIRDDSITTEKLELTLWGLFASVALALALVGVYGVMSYAVTQRTHEIGIRVALGAQSSDVLSLVIGQGMKPALLGGGIGLAAAWVLTRLMSSLLFGVSATDPMTFVGISLLLGSAALLACYFPARRATKVDPMIALRYE